MVELDAATGDITALREVYGCFPSGVIAVCALVGDEPVGIAASSFTSVSLEPSLVSVCVQNASTTWPRLRDRARLGLSVLAEGQARACRSLAAKTGDRFAGLGWSASDGGAVLVHGAAAWLDCSIAREVPAGDHAIVLLAVHALRAWPKRAPLVFHASLFRRLVAV